VIVLRELELHNIFQIKRAKIRFGNYGLRVIYGLRNGVPTSSNGTGKSSVLEALDLLLFDRTSKGVVANDILRRGSKSGFARLLLNIGDTVYEITKYVGRDKRIVLTENGKDISYKDQETTKGRIRKILPISYELWSNIICIGQGKSGLLFEGTDKERKDAFVQLLQLDVLDKALSVVRERKNKANDMVTWHSGKLSSLKIMEDDVANEDELRKKLKRKRLALQSFKEHYYKWMPKLERISGDIAKNLITFQHISKEIEKYKNAFINKVCPFCKTKLSNIDIVIREIKILKNKIKPIIEERISLKSKYKKLCKVKDNLDLSIETLENSVRNICGKIDLHVKVEKHNNKVEKERDKCLKEVKLFKKKLVWNKRLEDVFGQNGYRKYLISSVLDRITDEMNVLLRGIGNITVKFFTKGIKFDIIVIKDGVEFHKNSLSGGEKKLLSIAYNIALVNVLVGRSVNCLFYDEILSQLDDDNSIKAIDYLNKMANLMKLNIFLVTNQLHVINHINDNEDVEKICVNCVGGVSYVK